VRIRAVAVGGILVVGAAVGLAAGGWVGGRPFLPYPAGCAAYQLNDARCAALVAWAESQLPAGHPAIVATELGPDPVCADVPPAVVCQRLVAFVATVRFTLADGQTRSFPRFCGVGDDSLVCTEHPLIRIATNVDRDVLCSGPGDPTTTPNDCSTPVPSPDPSTAAAARPLRIAALDVPVTTVGHHELEVGTAGLPNGYVAEATLRLANDAPAGLRLDGPLRLELRPTDPSRPPFGNVYQRGTFPGVEMARVFLVFDAAEASPRAVIEVRDLVVR
jgi:hypothetical protein